MKHSNILLILWAINIVILILSQQWHPLIMFICGAVMGASWAFNVVVEKATITSI